MRDSLPDTSNGCILPSSTVVILFSRLMTTHSYSASTYGLITLICCWTSVAGQSHGPSRAETGSGAIKR